MRVNTDDLVGIPEAAEILGVADSTVRAARSRGEFPEPILVLQSTPIWTVKQIHDHGKRTKIRRDSSRKRVKRAT